MPIYSYTCDACGHSFDKMRRMAERDEPLPCPECEAETRRVISAVNFNLSGDDWASKNGRVAGQMAEKNRKLKVKEEEAKRDGKVPTLAPNVEGERVSSWSEAKKLAASKGKDTSGYDRMISKEKTGR